MNSKFALLTYQCVYGKKFNIGDYIQSIAAMQFLPHVDTLINREYLNDYNGDGVKLIMNGWFLEKPENWPPSSRIEPFFISYHLNSVAYDLLKCESALEYFRKYEPIGCRDKTTFDLLKKKGVKAYYSGCLTLTLVKNYKSVEKKDQVYFVDPYLDYRKKKKSLHFLKYFMTLIFRYKKIKILASKIFKAKDFTSLMKTAAFYIQYSKIFKIGLLLEANYITHDLDEKNFNDELEKLDYAKKLINIYACAKLVITSRIHCALPCLSLETPVIFINKLNKSLTNNCRLDGIIQLFNTIHYDNAGFFTDFIDLNAGKICKDTRLKNKDLHNALIKDLIYRCEEFVNS